MVKKLLIWLIPIIVIVSINWFKDALAQDLSQLSATQKAELLAQYRKTGKVPAEKSYYQSPDLFSDSTRRVGLPIQSPQSTNHKADSSDLEFPDSLNWSDKLIKFEDLRPFGVELFNGPRDNLAPVDVASASDYVLGPGDNIIVYLWGRVEKEYNLTIDREGKLFIPKAGELVAWGLTLEQFTRRAKTSLSKVYSEFDITVSLGKIRSIRVYVTGEVKYPGAYTVSSLTSIFDAIYHAGGPNERGTMRKIKLMRSGTCITTVDLYNLLLSGDNGTDSRLRTGDVIFVEVAENTVAIRGEIRRPALYELNGNETAADLLQLSGGATALAHLDRVMLERINDKGEWEVIDLNLNHLTTTAPSDMILQSGDRLTVYSIFDFKKNKVGIFGQVKHAGYYERNDSTRVSDLVKRGQLQPYDVYLERADLFRRHANWRTEVLSINLAEAMAGNPEYDFLLTDLDSIVVRSIKEIKREKWVYIEGKVLHPGKFKLYENMTAEDLVFLAGSYLQDAYLQKAEIARLDNQGEVSIKYFSLTDNSACDVKLQEDDRIYIRRISNWHENPTVLIEGEVLYPGKYSLHGRGETFYQLLNRTGGFTLDAFPRGIILKRPSIEARLMKMRIEYLADQSQAITTDSLGLQVEQSKFEYVDGSLDRIILDIDKILSSNGAEGDIVLEPGDKITVPSTPPGVSVLGAVGSNGTIQYMRKKNARDYIKFVGDFTDHADKNETRLIRAGGMVISGKKALGSRIELGDIIFVPTKVEKEGGFWKNTATAISAATGILTSVFIISKL